MDTKQIGSDFQKQFSAFKEEHQKASAMLLEVKGKIKALKNEDSEIRHARLNREDFADFVCGIVENFADEGRANLKRTVTMHVTSRDPGRLPVVPSAFFEWERLEKSVDSGKGLGNSFNALLTMSNPSSGYNFEGVFGIGGMCSLFEDVIKDSLRKNLASFAWPYPDAQPIEQRKKRLVEIEAALAPLLVNEGELEELLAQMGVLAD